MWGKASSFPPPLGNRYCRFPHSLRPGCDWYSHPSRQKGTSPASPYPLLRFGLIFRLEKSAGVPDKQHVHSRIAQLKVAGSRYSAFPLMHKHAARRNAQPIRVLKGQ